MAERRFIVEPRGLASGRLIVLVPLVSIFAALALGGLFEIIDQAHAQRTMGTDFFETIKRGQITVDRLLQFTTAVAEFGGIHKDRWNASVDHCHLQAACCYHILREF